MEEKIQFLVSDLDIHKITEDDKEDLSSFSCGDEPEYQDLNHFFQSEDLYLSDKFHYYSVYVVRYKRSNELVAIFTLSNDSIILSSEEDEADLKEEIGYVIADEYSEIWNVQTSFPAINIGHLGVCSKYQSSKIGRILINTILGTFEQFTISGCQFVTVDALNNPKTNKFYLDRGFTYLTNSDFSASTRRMYLLLNSVR